MDIINDSSYKLYKNAVGVDFPLEMRLDALTVVVDESYHALVALDLINQVEQMTSIAPLPMPKDTEASYALAQSLAMGDERLRELLRLVCVSLSEQALTTDLIDVINNEDIFPTFYLVMKDHVADEGRHARFSQQVLSHIWRHSDAATKQALQQPILAFLEATQPTLSPKISAPACCANSDWPKRKLSTSSQILIQQRMLNRGKPIISSRNKCWWH
ncbi:hypothetical protein CMV60_15230 [Serratia marcescens]|nr:hypothetical protein CMV60_15230 [Serratia marcescens]